MKDVFALMAHAYGKSAVKLAPLKRAVKELERFYDERKLPCAIKSDEDLLVMSAQRDALLQKERLDEQLFRSLEEMQDYIQTLAYEEINRLLLVDLGQVFTQLKCFDDQGQRIYLPCFSAMINERYTKSPALFTYSGYQHQLRHYESSLRWGMYGTLPYENGFGLFALAAREESGKRIVLLLREAGRLYLLESGKIVAALALPWKQTLKEETLTALAQALLKREDAVLIELLTECDEIKGGVRKKLRKLLSK